MGVTGSVTTIDFASPSFTPCSVVKNCAGDRWWLWHQFDISFADIIPEAPASPYAPFWDVCSIADFRIFAWDLACPGSAKHVLEFSVPCEKALVTTCTCQHFYKTENLT